MNPEEIACTSVDGEELLPCPFCGGIAIIFQTGNDKDGQLYNVQCMVCDMGGHGYFTSRKNALRVWNRREQNSSRFLCEEETLNEENVYERQMTLFQECE